MLRDKILDVIASGLPETVEMEKFCASEKFQTMLNSVMAEIRDALLGLLSREE